jgi:hypothetical protein
MRCVLAATTAALLLAGCHHDATGPTDRSSQRGQLRVTAVDVVVRESFPVQVDAHITGEVPNVCTSVDSIHQRRHGRTITMTIATRSESEACILILPPPVELSVPLAGPFDGGEYLLRVNDFEQRFRI